MLHDFGHHAVAKQLFDGSDSFDGFVAFTEEVMGQDFVMFVRSIMPRTIMEIVMQVHDVLVFSCSGLECELKGVCARTLAEDHHENDGCVGFQLRGHQVLQA